MKSVFDALGLKAPAHRFNGREWALLVMLTTMAFVVALLVSSNVLVMAAITIFGYAMSWWFLSTACEGRLIKEAIEARNAVRESAQALGEYLDRRDRVGAIGRRSDKELVQEISSLTTGLDLGAFRQDYVEAAVAAITCEALDIKHQSIANP